MKSNAKIHIHPVDNEKKIASLSHIETNNKLLKAQGPLTV